MDKSIENVKYFGVYDTAGPVNTNVIDLIGLDTEAYNTGKCFLICTSKGDSFKAEEFPQCLFTRQYRGKKFAVWNLKYDEGALLQWLPGEVLNELWKTGQAVHEAWKIRSIPQKMLSISRKSHTITIYDMYQFYGMSLEAASQLYLGEGKFGIETKTFFPTFVKAHWGELVRYCIQDALLVEKLSLRMVNVFLKFKIYPSKLYSTAYISYQYFKSHTKYPTVKKLWYENRRVLDYSMKAYKGGKFEVTRKGTGEYVEYDIVSAYPFEISKLVDITYARIIYGNKYRREAVYGFIKIRIKLPTLFHSPLAIKINMLSVYPVGEFETWCTKQEYDWLLSVGIEPKILEGCWIHVDNKTYPFKKEIERLVKLKQEYKTDETKLEYHTVKILLNSLYGKMVQLIKCADYWKASSCWNPIYASVITANVRIRITEMQHLYPTVVAVHTDSVISTKPLDIQCDNKLGAFTKENDGFGVILGSGIYQIGDKNRFRGFSRKESLLDLISSGGKHIILNDIHAQTWRETVFHKWNIDTINRFVPVEKKLSVDFDNKRIWLNDYKTFKDVLRRNVDSLPFDARLLNILF